MSLFADQPLRCQICGTCFMGSPDKKWDRACDDDCRSELERRRACYIVGKPYRREDDLVIIALVRRDPCRRYPEKETPDVHD